MEASYHIRTFTVRDLREHTGPLIHQAEAAKLAGVSLEAFMEKLSALGIPIVNYSPAELDDEIKNLD